MGFLYSMPNTISLTKNCDELPWKNSTIINAMMPAHASAGRSFVNKFLAFNEFTFKTERKFVD